MEILSIKCSGIFRRLRQKKHIFRIEEIKQLLDDIVAYLNKLPSDKRKTDGMSVLIVICDELASMNVFRLFDYSTLRNHQIFNYIKQTFEMLFIKSTHSQTISMTEHEEDCLDSISYLIAQLCLFQNEPVKLFYGKVPKKVFKVTEKPNIRDPTFDLSNRKSPELMEKPNLKTARLPPSAPPARPIDDNKSNITKILGMKKFPSSFATILNETESVYPFVQPHENKLPQRKYQDVFLSKSFFDILFRAIDDLSRNDYSPWHVKYKVVDRFVRLCSQLDIVDILLSPILKCLHSKNYRTALKTVEVNQIRFNPKQLFFIHDCPQFFIRHNFLQQEQVINSLCKRIIESTKSIFDKHFLATDIEMDSNEEGDRRLAVHVISCHLEFLYHLSLAPSSQQYFINSSIILQLLLILKQDKLNKSAQENRYLFNADVGIIAYSLLLLCNLAYEKKILLKLKNTNLEDICTELKFAQDDTIKFASKMLIKILNKDDININHEPMKLREAYIKFYNSITNKPKHDTKIKFLSNYKEIEIETKYTFLTESFIEKLLLDIKEISKEEYPPNQSKYKEAVRRIHICAKQETTEVQVLLDSVISCLTSDYYLKSYQTIDLTPKRYSGIGDEVDRTLAAKQIFYMRECPEFLCQQDYKRQKEIASILCLIMLKNAQIIFNQHLPVVIRAENQHEKNEMKNAQIEALRLHIKLLNHIALVPTVRQKFLATPIIDQIFLILENETLMDNNGRVINTHITIVQESLTFLYNLAFDKEITAILRTKNLLSICAKFCLEEDEIIHFTSQTLTVMLETQMVHELTDPKVLSKIYIEYMNKSFKEPRRPYHGIKLRGLMQNLQVIIQNDTFQENIVDEKEGLSALTKCTLIECQDDPSLNSLEKIRRFALNIVWDLLRSIYGIKASKQLKFNDQFVEHVLEVLTQTSQKQKQIANRIIWKLGDERAFRSEHAEKEQQKQKKRNDQIDDELNDTDEQFTTDVPQDDLISSNLIISFSNNTGDKIVCQKICNRLKTQNIRVYFEKEGQHRLDVIKRAVENQTALLVCLSNEYRKSKICMTEIEYAFKHKCPIIPVLTDANFKPKGWLTHLISEKAVIDFTQKNITDAMHKLLAEINKLDELDQ